MSEEENEFGTPDRSRNKPVRRRDRSSESSRSQRPNRYGVPRSAQKGQHSGPKKERFSDSPQSRSSHKGHKPQGGRNEYPRPSRKHPPREGKPRFDSSRSSENEELTEEEIRFRKLRRVRPEHIDPVIDDDVTEEMLDKAARNELKTLTKENAEFVAKHLVMASRLLDDDPELAHQHVISASRRAGRIAMVREALGITAYTIGDYALALRELRTFRRISGSEEQIALMVDSERGVGRPDRALELGRSVDRKKLSAATQVALAIAMSGARLDLDQVDLALAELEIPQLDPRTAYSYSPALFRAYAEVLEELGRHQEAAEWISCAEIAERALDNASPASVMDGLIVIEEEGDPEDSGEQ